ncbi:ABC transporter permease [Occallatibacter savannae]|uniref:ABC transporter permease n=1 Tax=Occallatibacter savannae TaxID=1002691 RepID=UPI0019507910|nr:ABC transporter permease [Occallatibacter savannae]
MPWLASDVKHSLRTLFRAPAFAIAVIATLALGIGMNTAIFTVVNTVLLKPLSYPNADRIVQFGQRSVTIASFRSNVPEFHTFQRQTNVFQEVAAYDMSGPGFNLTGERPEQVRGIHVTEGYFRLFDAPVMRGRTFTQQEDLPNGGKAVVLSYGLWQRRFGSDPAIVGKSLLLGNEPYTILGILGKDFVPQPQADIWLPFQFPQVSSDFNSYFRVAALLRPGVTLAQAKAQLKLAAAEFRREYPDTNQRLEFHIEPLRDSIVGDSRKSLTTMLAAVGLVLLIACSNVANLLLLRATARRREIAVRCALGAGGMYIVRQFLIESVLLSLAGGLLGLALGFAGVRGLLTISPADLPRIGENGSQVAIDWRVLVFTLVISLITAVLFGLFPALVALRTDLNSALKDDPNRSGTGLRQGKTRSLLVILEFSLALVLVIGSTLLIRTLRALHTVKPGFDAQNTLTLEMSVTGDRFETTAGVAELSRNGRERLNSMPGIEIAAAAFWLPNYVGDALPFQILGQPLDRDHQYASSWMSISPGYLSVFRIPVLRGRDITENDTASSPHVALINETMANRYWHNQDPVGQKVDVSRGLGPGLNESTCTVVGVVGDTHTNGPRRPPEPVLLVPITQVTDAYTASYSNVQPLLWVVRTRTEPQSLITPVTEQLRIASGGFPVGHIQTMEDVMHGSTARDRFNMLLLTSFAGVDLILAAVGIFGVLAYSVAQRNQEMAIRMALGADRPAIRKLVIWSGMRLALIGITVGLAAAPVLTRFMESFLFAVRPWDPVALLFAPVVLIIVALVAVWAPGMRACSIDPLRAIRTE